MNYTLPNNFGLTVWDRLVELGAPTGDRHAAMVVLSIATSDLKPQSFATSSTVTELVERVRMEPDEFRGAVNLLARAGAGTVVRRHGGTRLALTVAERTVRGPRPRYPGGVVPIGDRLFRTMRTTA